MRVSLLVALLLAPGCGAGEEQAVEEGEGDGAASCPSAAAQSRADAPGSDQDAPFEPLATNLCGASGRAGPTEAAAPRPATDGRCPFILRPSGQSLGSTCPAPSVLFPGGSLEELRRLSPDLVFGRLVLAGDLQLAPADGMVTIWARSFIAAEGGVVYVHDDCEWSRPPSLTVLAQGAVIINKPVALAGRAGERTTGSSSCAVCDGAPGGSVRLEGASITVNSSIETQGGRGGTRILRDGLAIACDGGDGGDLVLRAREVVELGPFALDPHGGEPGRGTLVIAGTAGRDGAFEWQAPVVRVNEKEPNAPVSLARWLPADALTVYGSVSARDDHHNLEAGLLGRFPNGTSDFVEDLFVLTTGVPRNVKLILSGVGEATDLELYAFSWDGDWIAAANGPGANESLSLNLTPGRLLVGVSYVGEGPAANYALSVLPVPMR